MLPPSGLQEFALPATYFITQPLVWCLGPSVQTCSRHTTYNPFYRYLQVSLWVFLTICV